MKKSQPIRMCITCRERNPQNTLIRLKHNGGEVIAFDGKGRSFYLCMSCVNNEKKIKGLAKRFNQELEPFCKLIASIGSSVDRCEKSHRNEGVVK